MSESNANPRNAELNAQNGSSLHLANIPSEHYIFWNFMVQDTGADEMQAHQGNVIAYFPGSRDGFILADVIRLKLLTIQIASVISETTRQVQQPSPIYARNRITEPRTMALIYGKFANYPWIDLDLYSTFKCPIARTMPIDKIPHNGVYSRTSKVKMSGSKLTRLERQQPQMRHESQLNISI